MNPKSKEWKCEQCGRCCKYVALQADLNEDQKRWLNAHNGIKVGDDNIVIIRSQCVFLRHSGRLYKCALHETDIKPKMCRDAGKEECVRHNEKYTK